MEAGVRDLVRRIHDSGRRLVVAATGGGATAAAWLLAVPGASRTVLEAVVPYAERALVEWLGRAPASFCSREAAVAMAERARDRAAWLCPGDPTVGLACTASLRSDRPKRGDHRVHLAAAADDGGTRALSLTLARDRRSREEEEEVVCRLMLNLLAEALGLPDRLGVALLEGETPEASKEAPGPLSALLRGDVAAVCVGPGGRMTHGGRPPALLLPGSFNPVHEGHFHLAEVAARRVGLPAAFEITVANADKPPLGAAEVRRRLAQFGGRATVWLTRAATFTEKARLFPGAVFVVGADTAVRVVEPRFYAGGSEAAMREALGELRQRGCRFLVGGRVNGDGAFAALEHLALPAGVADLFEGISESEFRRDVSSTALRAKSSTG